MGKIKVLRLNTPLERIYFNWDKIKNDEYMFKHFCLHMNRYSWALQFVRDKIVSDVGCGTCYGSWMLSTVARKMFLIDHDEDVLKYHEVFPFCCEHDVICGDVDDINLPQCDITVAFEFIEHLEDPSIFLNKINSKWLLWSIPLNLKGEFHKTVFKSIDEFIDLLHDNGWHNMEEKMECHKLDKGVPFYHGVAGRGKGGQK